MIYNIHIILYIVTFIFKFKYEVPTGAWRFQLQHEAQWGHHYKSYTSTMTIALKIQRYPKMPSVLTKAGHRLMELSWATFRICMIGIINYKGKSNHQSNHHPNPIHQIILKKPNLPTSKSTQHGLFPPKKCGFCNHPQKWIRLFIIMEKHKKTPIF